MVGAPPQPVGQRGGQRQSSLARRQLGAQGDHVLLEVHVGAPAEGVADGGDGLTDAGAHPSQRTGVERDTHGGYRRIVGRPAAGRGGWLLHCAPCPERSSPGSPDKTANTSPSSSTARDTTCSGWSRDRTTRASRPCATSSPTSSRCRATSPTCRHWSRPWSTCNPTRCTTSGPSPSSPSASTRPS